MKRFLIRQLSLVLALVMLLTLTGLAEDLSMDVLELQEVDLGELSLDDVAIDGDMELELSDIEAEAPMPEAVDESGEAPAEALEDEPIELGESGDEAAEAPTGEAAEEPTKEPAEEPTEEIVAEATEGTVEEPGLAIEEGPEENALVLVGEETEEAGGAGSGQVHSDIPGAQADNDALADAYLRAMLPGFDRGGRTLASPDAGRKMLAQQGLTATLALYDALKPMIEQVAAGKRTSTQFEFDAAAMGTTDHWWTPGELGASGFNDANLGNCLLSKEGFDTGALMSALLEDCPYHLYWFDKTGGWDFNYGWDSDGSGVRLSGMTIMMVVSQDYAAGTYTVNALPAYVRKATSNINSIISKNASKGDLEKVTAYADVICNYVEYNHPAADNDNTPYGDPWQLVWIFDGNADTKVVCEGYAKGFKYLCDLSTFQGNVGCVLAQGMLTGGTGEGPHMWNSLQMPDGRVYLVDLTNCDAGNKCNYSLFLKGVTGEAGGPYVCKGLRYEFDDGIKKQFGKNSPWLTYSNADYGKSGGGTGDGKVNADWTALQAQINAAANNTTIKLTKNITASGGNVGLEIPAGKRLTLDLAGHTLNRGLKAEKVDGYVLEVEGSLVIKDSVGGGKITGGWNADRGGGIFFRGKSLILAGGEISGNRADSGGGVFVGNEEGLFKMTGGKISGNSAVWGGGVYVSHGKENISPGRMEMSGGQISGNTAKYGGGISVLSGSCRGYHEAGVLKMTGGSITDNTAEVDGGGVYSMGIIVITGGRISGNSAESGGGLECRGDSITIKGCEISGNTAENGGGLRCGEDYDDKEIIISNVTITGNTAETGGGIIIGGEVIELTGCTITNNTASKCGGGITGSASSFIISSTQISGNTAMYGGGIDYYDASGELKLTDCTITNNTASENGGGIRMGKSWLHIPSLTMTNTTISGNNAKDGGGIYQTGVIFTLDSGEIRNNTASHAGGGMYITNVYEAFEPAMTGGSIVGNHAQYGGGIYFYGSGFKLSGGAIKENTARDEGGGIYAYDSRQFAISMTGGTIEGNTSAHRGGGVYLWAAFSMTGGTITGNAVTKPEENICGGGVYFEGGGEFSVSGAPVIYGNHQGQGSGARNDNVTLGSNQEIAVTGRLGATARIGFAGNEGYTSDKYHFTYGLGANGNIGAFFSDDPNYTIEWSDDGQEACLAKKATPTDPAQPTEPAIVPLSDCRITVKNQSYTGKKIKAKVTVKYGDVKLKKGTDYTVSYKNNKAIGVATATVKGLGSYTGTKKLTFKILPRSTPVSKLKAGKKSLTVTWKKRTEATGYQVQYALKSSFSGAKTVKVKKAKTVKATIKSLKAGKKYYVRVRSYKTVGKKTYYSAWSKAKNVKVK